MGIDAMMFVRTKASITKKQLRVWSYQLGATFGSGEFWFGYPKKTRHALEFCERWEQDGPDIAPNKNETFIQVNMCCRYYGTGYERGPFPFIFMLAEWLERNIPGSEVWYGGDSSGVCAEKFDRKAREKLLKHFCTSEGFAYRQAFDNEGNGPMCELCKVNMTQYMWCGNGGGYTCLGCGEKLETRDNGVTFSPPKDATA